MNDLITEAAMICGAIISAAAVFNLVVTAVKKLKAPSDVQNQRLDKLEERVDKHDEFLRNDLERFKYLETGNKIMQRCMLALLKHSIDSSDIDGMKAARKDLEEYLIEH